MKKLWEEVVGHSEPSSLRAAQEHFVKDTREAAGQGRGEVGSQVFMISR